VIATEDLSRGFHGRPAVDGLTIDVEEGEVLALLGPNGAGKTTTIRLLNGILLLIFLAVGQSTGLLLVTLPIAVGIGVGVWAIALMLILRGAGRFTRDRVSSA